MLSRALTPIDVLRNCRGKAVSIELISGETINGIVMRTDRTMNVVLKQSIRTSAYGDAFWKARECLVRGASVRTVRFDETVLKLNASSTSHQRKRRREVTKDSKGSITSSRMKHSTASLSKHSDKRTRTE